MRRGILTLLAVLLAGGLVGPAAAAARVRCGPASFQVPGGTLAATVCRPDSGQPTATAVLVHGSTYDDRYWSPPIGHSTSRALAARGYQVVAVDRLGSGQSTRLSDEAQTADASAAALHGVVQRVRQNPAYRTSSRKVVMVGHSSGSTLTIRVATSYPGSLDGVIVTGLLHTPGIGADVFLTMLHPAAEDPKFAGDPSIPPGYVTTVGQDDHGVRVLWYAVYGSQVDPRMVPLDEAQLKDAMPGVDSGGFVDEVFVQPRSPRVTVPVLVIIGNADLSHCHPGCPNATAERGFWPKAASYRLVVLPQTGHVIALHRTAAVASDRMADWLDDR
jgi:pimeloyl-ACP methyl ester carboxylesterase